MKYDIIDQAYDIIVHDSAYDISNDMHYDINYDIIVRNYDIIVHIIPMISYMICSMISYIISCMISYINIIYDIIYIII